MRTLQYILAEQVAMSRLGIHGLIEYVQEDMAIEGSTDAKDNFLTDLNTIEKHLAEAQRLLLKHGAAPSVEREA